MSYKSTGSICIVALMAIQVWTVSLWAHCEIPCGIYNDKMRIDMLKEHITTIEKSMNQITELAKAGDKNYNQLIRWVSNKEKHAEEFQHIVTQYFMTQRIKLPADDSGRAAYVKNVTTLHEMLVFAMKCKQTTDVENCTKLRALVDTFAQAYFGSADLEHLEGHHG
jgi:nickel superoxide dismutase